MDCKEAPSEEVLFKPRSPGRKESRPRKGRRKGGPAGENWWCKCPEAGTSWACGRTKKAEIAWESRTWSQGYQPWLEEVTGVEKTRELRKAEPGAGRAESPPGSWGFAVTLGRPCGCVQEAAGCTSAVVEGGQHLHSGSRFKSSLGKW